ncbi:hypothetical protein [Nostoc sp. FACHB-190]|uniref:hypothetical protein n=1 Tax=Nostoc sp. FACHB-190 TaxID=2692838 RepID=UPI0016822AA0|nr:hypothetical protein [Nostoc sp. FACHB-190]MBD2299067.1 hypothetical protein [Nostoc sp. FACHB-190]
MSLFKIAADFVGDVGFGVIKNSGRILFGGGKAIVGVVTDDQELLEEGLKGAGKGVLGLGSALVMKNLNEDDSESTEEDIDIDV